MISFWRLVYGTFVSDKEDNSLTYVTPCQRFCRLIKSERINRYLKNLPSSPLSTIDHLEEFDGPMALNQVIALIQQANASFEDNISSLITDRKGCDE